MQNVQQSRDEQLSAGEVPVQQCQKSNTEKQDSLLNQLEVGTASTEDWAVGALVGTTHVTYAQSIQVVQLKHGFIEALWCIVVIHSNRDEPRHVGNRIPPLRREIDTNR